MTALRCAITRRRLPLRAARPGRHGAACLRCQAEHARYQALLRGLRDLRDVEDEAPDVLVSGVLAAVGRPDAAPAVGSGRATVFAIAGGTAVAIAAAAIAVHHRRAA